MIKRTIKETISEYDSEGRLVRQTVTETAEDDDTTYFPTYPYLQTPPAVAPYWSTEPVCTCDAANVSR